MWKRGFINPCPWFIPRSKNSRESGRENGAVTSSKFGMLQQLGQKALVVPLQRVIKTKGCHIENMRFYLFFLRKKKTLAISMPDCVPSIITHFKVKVYVSTLFVRLLHWKFSFIQKLFNFWHFFEWVKFHLFFVDWVKTI